MNPIVTAYGEGTSLADHKRRAGQRMIIGLFGHAVDDDFRALCQEIRPAGFILFQRNVAEPAQVRDLNRELASLCDPAWPAFLSVDQEGGRVQRVRTPATVWPPMRAVGRSSNLTNRVSKAMAIELRAMGFNLNFAPVADVDSNPKNPVIGDRSFGESPAEVAKHVVAFIRGHQDNGVIACAKHFPGHGDTLLDSHHDLPIVEREEPDLRQTELVPFVAAVNAGVGTVMSAHVVYPAWDEDRPATMSTKVLRRLLREELKFDGVVFSDDMDMKAMYGRFPLDEQVTLATAAGVDLFLCCNNPKSQVETFEELVRAQEQHSWFEKQSRDSVKRAMALRERFFVPRQVPELSEVGKMEHTALAEEVAHRGLG